MKPLNTVLIWFPYVGEFRADFFGEENARCVFLDNVRSGFSAALIPANRSATVYFHAPSALNANSA